MASRAFGLKRRIMLHLPELVGHGGKRWWRWSLRKVDDTGDGCAICMTMSFTWLRYVYPSLLWRLDLDRVRQEALETGDRREQEEWRRGRREEDNEEQLWGWKLWTWVTTPNQGTTPAATHDLFTLGYSSMKLKACLFITREREDERINLILTTPARTVGEHLYIHPLTRLLGLL